jgi:hypothetical protein
MSCYGKRDVSNSYHQMVGWDRSRDERECVLVALPCRHDQRWTISDWADNAPHDDFFDFHRNRNRREADAVCSRAGGERIDVADPSDRVESDFSRRADACSLYRGRVWWRLCDGARSCAQCLAVCIILFFRFLERRTEKLAWTKPLPKRSPVGHSVSVLTCVHFDPTARLLNRMRPEGSHVAAERNGGIL